MIGANSIFIYCVHGIWDDFILETFKTHLGQNVFKAFGEDYELLLGGASVLLVFWLILYWMYRQRIFFAHLIHDLPHGACRRNSSPLEPAAAVN